MCIAHSKAAHFWLFVTMQRIQVQIWSIYVVHCLLKSVWFQCQWHGHQECMKLCHMPFQSVYLVAGARCKLQFSHRLDFQSGASGAVTRNVLPQALPQVQPALDLLYCIIFSPSAGCSTPKPLPSGQCPSQTSSSPRQSS